MKFDADAAVATEEDELMKCMLLSLMVVVSMTENEERERDGLWWHERSHDAYGSVQVKVVDLFVVVSVHTRHMTTTRTGGTERKKVE